MNDNLLRDAIMEAKQVKAAAIASAKIALEEAFQPHLQSILSKQLRMETELNETVPNSSSGIGTGNNKKPEGFDSSNIPNPGQELASIGENPAGINHTIGGSRKAANNTTDAHPENLHEDENGNPFEKEFDDEDDQVPGEEADANQLGSDIASMDGEDNFGGSEGEFGGPQDGGEGGSLDIQSIIDELEADILGSSGDMGGGEEEMGGQPPMPEQEGAMYEETLTGTSPTPNEKLPFGTGDTGEDDAIRGDAKKAPNGSDGLPEKLHEEDEEMDEEVDLTEILREMDVQENIQNQGTDPNYRVGVEKIMSENANLKRSLKEHRDVVRFLKDRINEINMLNAKLLFTNKLFKQYNLNGGQKMKVVENFDLATTLREIKIIFATLAEAYAAKNSASTKTVRSITEGIASRATGSTKPNNPAVLNESDSVVARFKQLAHIL